MPGASRLDPERGVRAVWALWLPGSPDAVLVRYRERHRRYHTTAHLTRVVHDVGAITAFEPVDDLAAVYAAAFLHDAVYDPHSSTNEADSAALAGRVLPGWPPERISEVERLVLTTADHRAGDPAAVALADADLAVLGAGPEDYERYRAAVRAEYAHVDDDAWRVGRAQVLESFLNRSAILRSETMRQYEAAARRNLGAELESLR